MQHQLIRKIALFGTLGAFLTLICATTAFGQKGNEALFESDEALRVEIQAPWRKFTRNKKAGRYPATLTIEDDAVGVRSFDLTIERRGISRQEVCDFPPIRLRFNKQSVKGSIFEGEGALKLVTHCNRGKRWAHYYVLEMLAYRIYNLITEYSFRVRPLIVRYRDVDRDKDADENFAFVIEDIDEVADRLELIELDIQSTRVNRLNPEVTSQMALFQLLIGNLDWSARTGPDGCCHNAKLIGVDATNAPRIPIPYDFDSSGFVDAHYALPPEGLGVRSVTSRLFRGYCLHNPRLPAARQLFLARKDEINALVREEPRINDRIRKKALDYLEEYFEILADDEEFDDAVISKCRG